MRSKLENSVPILKYLLANGADPNIHKTGCNTPLLQAVVFGIKDAVESLLEHGADVHHVGPDGLTALHISCMTQSEEKFIFIRVGLMKCFIGVQLRNECLFFWVHGE